MAIEKFINFETLQILPSLYHIILYYTTLYYINHTTLYYIIFMMQMIRVEWGWYLAGSDDSSNTDTFLEGSKRSTSAHGCDE